MSKKLIITFFLCVFVFLTNIFSVEALETELNYTAIPEGLKYTTDIFFENVVNTNQTRVSTKFNIVSEIENEISRDGANLFLKLTFNSIALNEYKRELKVLNKKLRKAELDDRADIEITLKERVLYKWINLLMTKKGVVLEKYNSSDISKVDFFDMTQVAEQFVIPLPDKQIRVGQQWTTPYSYIFPSALENESFLAEIEYTYLGQEECQGILCYKLRSLLYLEDTFLMNLNDGLTKISWLSFGTHYLAVDGNYLVESNLTSNLLVLVVIGQGESQEIRNFTQTGVEYKIKLIKD